MRIPVASILIAMLVFSGVAPAVTQTNPDKGTSVGTAATADPPAEMNNYTNHAQGEMQLWEQKLRDFNARADTNATEAQKNANKNLDDAWTETKKAWGQVVKVGLNVGTAGANDWDSAKASFRATSDKLAAAWQKANPAGQ